MQADPLEPIEIASGLVFGGGRERRRPTRSTADARAALERTVLPALQRPPCVVSFSGGRDSSAVLALATHVARREALPLPIPATNRFPAVDDTDESSWQELVVSHLRLPDWHRLEFTDELDVVGPVATAALLRHGLLWPFNAFFHVPLLEAARGGTLLTGIGGDEQLGESRYARANAVLARRVRPEPRDLLRVGLAFAPGFVRAARLRRAPPVEFRWLSDAGRRTLVARWAADVGREPRRYDRRVRWWPTRRSAQVGFRSLRLLAADAGAEIAHPLADLAFAAGLASLGGNPPGDRTTRMQALFGDLLPRELLERRTKAHFDAAFWTRHARDLSAEWSGDGSPAALVDPDRLREEWATELPAPQSYLLLQSAWLAGRRDSRSD